LIFNYPSVFNSSFFLFSPITGKSKVLEEITKTASLKTQSAWLLFAKLVGFAISLFLPLLIVRRLTQEEVGIYRQVFLVIVTANVVLPLSFGISAFYYLARETDRRASVIFNTLLFNFTVGGLACLALWFFPQMLGNVFQSQEMTRLAPSIGVVIWLWIFSTFLETVAIANQEARLATAFIIFAQLTKAVLMISAVVVFATVESFIYAAMAQAAVQSIVLLVYLNSRFPGFWTAFDASFFREQLFYALPFGLAGLLWTVQTDIHNYFVGYRFSSADYAVYAYGCFQLPLIAMLAESVAAVLMPRMSELEAQNDTREIIRLTGRTMQKLAVVYFPFYIFLLITAETFITTLFTHNYSASVPIFMINLTLLPLYIWITDPIVRAYRELGNMLLAMRVFIIIALVAALYFGIQHFDLRGMIAIVVVTAVIERVISTVIVFRKLNVRTGDLAFLKDIAKTAAVSLLAGAATFLFYRQAAATIFLWGANLTRAILPSATEGLIDFTAGSFVLGACGLLFAPIYLGGMNGAGLIEDGEKEKIKSFFKRLLLFGRSEFKL